MYRTNAKPISPRWGVTRWQRFYVRFARVFLDLREKYSYQREYNQYLRNLDRWQGTYGKMLGPYIQIEIGGANRFRSIGRLAVPPMPLPPPIHIRE